MDIDISLGDQLLITGILQKPSNNTIPNLFNYQKYLYYQGIHYILIPKNIKKVTNNTNVIYYLKDKITKKINSIGKSHEYIKIFILGDSSSLDKEVLNSFQKNGISHLFSISGMHISLFAAIVLFFLKKISYNNFYNYSIVILFLSFYALLIGFTPSVTRSLIMYLLFSINKLFNIKMNNINIMCLVLIISLIINPYYLYNLSFQYSYLISFSLVLFSYKIKPIKNKIVSSLYTSFISFLVSFPITIYNFYQVNVLSIILNIIFIPFVSIIIFPLSLICFVFPYISFILEFFVKILECISLYITKYKIGIVKFPKPSLLLIIIYYIGIYLFIYNKKNIYIFAMMIFHKYAIYFNPLINITYLDVGQGDSIFIKDKFNKNNILIDTGGRFNSKYSIVENQTIPYLTSIGINKIHYLIITHGDYDHIGEAINLVNNFKVDNVIFNIGNYNKLELDLIKVLHHKKIPYYQNIKSLNINNNKLYFLNTRIYDNENDNSSVIYVNINNKKLLFMGDAEKNKEKDIIKKYNIKNIDILKVGHHGSNTSSNKEFIDNIKPKNCIISVGKNNHFGHPTNEVIDTLDDYCNIYRTDKFGSIEIKFKNNNYEINTINP